MSEAILLEPEKLTRDYLGPGDVQAEADRVHHRERARAELDMAYRAVTRAAAEAHLRLASLHMERLARLGSR